MKAGGDIISSLQIKNSKAESWESKKGEEFNRGEGDGVCKIRN